MTRAFCRIQALFSPPLPSSGDASADIWTLEHGDIIGRMRRADLRVDSPRVSEAHAMVSLRGQQLKLLGLRGGIWSGNSRVSTLELKPGVRFAIGQGLDFEVVEVRLPPSVLAVEGAGLLRQPLPGVSSVFLKPHPTLIAGLAEDADAIIWGENETWWFRVGEQSPVAITPESRVAVGDLELRFHLMPLASAGEKTTLAGSMPLRIIAGYDTVQVHQGDASAFISGIPARIISELIDFGVAVEWDSLAGNLWSPDHDRQALRARFDMALSRLRRKLRDAGIRDDLIVSSGHGHVELVLRENDTVEDRM